MYLPEIVYFDIKDKLHLDIIEKIKDGTIQSRVPFLVEYYWLEFQDDKIYQEVREISENSSIVIDVLVAQINEQLKRTALKEKEEVNIYFTPSNLDRLIQEYLSL